MGSNPLVQRRLARRTRPPRRLPRPVPVIRRVAMPIGYIVIGLAGAMALCGLVGLTFQLIGFTRPGVDDGAALSMFVASLFTALGGMALRAWGDDLTGERLSRRDALVLTTLAWVVASAFGAVPFMIDAHMTAVDALFEADSGFTTTGATVVVDIEHTLSRPLLLWRALTQWLGGMGIIVLFVALFPGLRIGGKHLLQAEVPGPTPDHLRPRVAETALALWGMYVALTLVEIVALAIAGMGWFEALCHALTTISTGGFSTRDASIGAFGSPGVEMVVAVFMLLAGVNFGLYYRAMQTGRVGVLPRSTEFRVYVGIVAGVSATLTMLNLGHHQGVMDSFRGALFTTATFLTSTGYGTEDYMLYGAPGLALVLMLMFTGGSSGSTAGGIKVSRVVLTFKALWAELKRQVRPRRVHIVRLGRVPQEDQTLLRVVSFVCVFFIVLGVGAFVILFLEPNATPDSAFGATLSCLSNMGPAPFHLGADNFAAYSDCSKLLFSMEMILGRLEFITVLALAVPEVWRP